MPALSIAMPCTWSSGSGRSSAGKYLEYKMTAEDPKVLARPYTYTRYYEKLKTEIMDDECRDAEGRHRPARNRAGAGAWRPPARPPECR